MLNDVSPHVSFAPCGTNSMQHKMMPSDVITNKEHEADSAGVGGQENSPSFLDTITEEEEDPSSASLDASENITVQHRCLPTDRVNSETDLLEAQYLRGHGSDGMNRYTDVTNLDYTEQRNQETSQSKLNERSSIPQVPANSILPVEMFPIELKGMTFYKTQLPPETFQCPSYSCPTYLDRRDTKSLPSVALPLDACAVQRNRSSYSVCMAETPCSLANSKAPSPTGTQLNYVAEWAFSSPGVTTITDNPYVDLNSCGMPSPLAVAVSCSIDTEPDDYDRYYKNPLEVPNTEDLSKCSPALHGAGDLLDVESDSPQQLDCESPVITKSLSTSESLTSSMLSLSRRYSGSSQMPPRPVYDYGTDETLLEIFMTPAVDGMESDNEEGNAHSNGPKKQLSIQILQSLADDNSNTGIIWQDTCEETSVKGSNTNRLCGLLEDASDLPFIDNEESYSETWYITASQQFSWLDRAQLADFDEITRYYGNSSEQLNGKAEEKGIGMYSSKLQFIKKRKLQNRPQIRRPHNFLKSPFKSVNEKNRWTSWVCLLCGCVSNNHGIV